MIKLACKIPRSVVIACSGGPDSMAALDFCVRGKRNVSVAHFNHGTEESAKYQSLVSDYCNQMSLELKIGNLQYEKPERESREEWWRNCRIKFFAESFADQVIVTGHNLDDAAEWWLMSSIHGKSKAMSVETKYESTVKLTDNWSIHETELSHTYGKHNVTASAIKPFLFARKSVLRNWCDNHSVPYLIDPTNLGNSDGTADNGRASVRNFLIPQVVNFHPGFFTTVLNLLKSNDGSGYVDGSGNIHYRM